MNMGDMRDKRKKIICNLLADPFYVPMKKKELAHLLQVPMDEKEEFGKLLDELIRDGKITQTTKGKIIKGRSQSFVGTFLSTQKGFGFVSVEGKDEDYYVPDGKTLGAFHKDLVEVIPLNNQNGKRKEVQIIKVLEHGITELVGTFQKSKNFGFVVPDNLKIDSDIFIPIEQSKNAVDGHKVLVKLTNYGCENKSPEGKVIEILGHKNDPGVDILSIVKGFDLPMEFSDKVLNQAERVSSCVSEADMVTREDLRNLTMVTIDGEDAKDLDDAVSVYKQDGDYYLGVHIADVSNYVQENSALDREALKRGTSVYLVDRVIPMLPHTLSNGICSLNEGENRLALSCLMHISPTGEIKDYKIVESVICVNRRMSYTVVNEILENSESKLIERYEELVPMFYQMRDLAEILRNKRRKRGSIDFDFPESKIILDESGKPLDIRPYERNTATRIIEDFMLVANETVAQHYYWLEVPFLYRTHDIPDTEKIQKLSTFIQNFGYYMKSARKTKSTKEELIHPKEIQKLMDKISGTKEEAMISRLTLRSMKRAQYTTECTGHFGLACPYYCHFTSPIRRYPDLQIHRIIKEQIRGRMNEKRLTHYESILPLVAKQTSDLERRADEAERETEKLKKVEFMEQHVGEVYEGVISGITTWGIYVELPNTVEGMIHISKIPGDFYNYHEDTYEMVGESTGKTFKLGEPLKIHVDGTDKLTKTIDFSIVSEDEECHWENYVDRE